MKHEQKNKLATKMNGNIRRGRFDSKAWKARKEARHLAELRRMGVISK